MFNFKKTPEQKGRKIAKLADDLYSYAAADKISAFLAEPAILPRETARGSSLLAVAISFHHVKLVAACLDQGLHVGADTQYYCGQTALQLAVGKNMPDVCKKLIEDGADFRVEDSGEKTLLMSALSEGHLDLAKYLQKQGLSLADVTNDGYSCVTAAIESRDADILKYVLSAKPKISLKHVYDDKDHLFQAIEAESDEMFDLLVKAGMKADPQSRGPYGENLLSYARDYDSSSATTRKLSQMQKERQEAQRKVAYDAEFGWRLTAPDTVCQISEIEALGLKVTEIFNFSAGLYTRINRHMKDKIESSAVLPLGAMQNTGLMAEAARQLTALGGRLPDAMSLMKSAIPVVKRAGGDAPYV